MGGSGDLVLHRGVEVGAIPRNGDQSATGATVLLTYPTARRVSVFDDGS